MANNAGDIFAINRARECKSEDDLDEWLTMLETFSQLTGQESELKLAALEELLPN